MRIVRALISGGALAVLLTASASAAPIAPAFTTFGTLTGATFGGSGIPNDSVAITTTTSGITLGLTAHQRYVGPNLANDGAGTFTAFTGVSTDAPSPADPYATWNFGFYIGGSGAANYAYRLLYDLDPGVGTDEGAHRTLGPFGLQVSPVQDSWNLGMNFLEAPDTFNPTAPGEYTFALVAYELTGQEVARSAIRVNVVPEPTTLMLLGLGLAAAGRKLRRQ